MTARTRPATATPSPITGGLAEGVWCLSTPNSSYVLAVAADGRLVQLHWGARLLPGDGSRLGEAAAVPPYQLPLESQEPLPVDGGLRWGPPSLQIAFPGGVRSLELRLVDDVVAAESARTATSSNAGSHSGTPRTAANRFGYCVPTPATGSSRGSATTATASSVAATTPRASCGADHCPTGSTASPAAPASPRTTPTPG
jgi:hypothetical protein